ncbi:MAG TPA: TlpA disulfide reductase family protein [Chitinophagaceae bacterium]|nr:TlpA disulfide reductase family protein [Chitinophagaceae bacterium]
MKRIFYALMFSLSLNAATSQTLKGLKIGDTLPPVMVTYLDGKETRQAEVSSFYKSKFLVLDFWATWCAACLRAMPEADSIINQFGGRIKFLPVTYEDRKTVREFASKNRILSKHKFQLVVEDSLMMGGYFKFRVLPHQVWIDSNGIVRAITYPDQLSYNSLLSFVSNGNISVEEKIDEVEFDPFKPLKDTGAFLYRSLLTSYKPGIGYWGGTTGKAYDERSRVDRFFAINHSLLDLYYVAFSQANGSLNLSRVELNISDSTTLNPFFTNEGTPPRSLLKQYCLCYELILPSKVPRNVLYPYMLADLNRFSKFQGSIEKRQRRCWILVNRDKAKNPLLTTGEPKVRWQGGFISRIENRSIDVLTEYLNWNMELPVVNESGYEALTSLDLDITANATKSAVYFDVEKVRKSLKKYGFDIVEGERNIDVLVIREKK